MNFILDRDFTGTKVKLEGGETNYGDNRNYKLEISKGFGFADGRGHVLLSGEYYNNDGVVNGNGGREWARTATNYILNPANPTGAPGPAASTSWATTCSSRRARTAASSTPPTSAARPTTAIRASRVWPSAKAACPTISTTAPTPGPARCRAHRRTSSWPAATMPRRSPTPHSAWPPSEKRENIFGRVAYDVTENANVFVQVSRSVDSSYGIAFPQYQVGNSIKVLSGNPYIPAPIQAQMGPNDFFYLGSTNYDMGFVDTGTSRGTNRYVLGAEGKLDLFGSPWKWSAYAQIGTTSTDYHVYNARNNAHYTAALDAVTDPATGLTVCRSSLTNRAMAVFPGTRWAPA